MSRTYADAHTDVLAAWRLLASNPPDDLDPWCTRRLATFAEREVRAADESTGDALLHCDVRPDNILVRPDGRVVLVDWAWTYRGAWWVDPVQQLMSVVIQGARGSDPAGDLLDVLRLAGAPRDHIETHLLTMLGMFELRSREPAPPGLPTLRPWPRHCAVTLRGWPAQHVRTV